MVERRARFLTVSALFIIAIAAGSAFAQNAIIPGVQLPAPTGVRITTAELMLRQAQAPPRRERPDHELEGPERDDLPQNPNAMPVSSYAPGAQPQSVLRLRPTTLIHTTGASFDGATLTDTGAFPPDSMGTVGPTQYVVFVNGRIRTFTKAGAADGVINIDPDVFFASVMTPVSPPVVLNFTSDPNVRYDRFSARWFMSIIDVPCTNAGCTTTAANRYMLAVSDAVSAGVISGTTVWTLFQFQADPGTNFLDYPSFGIDVNAIYMGGNMFSAAGSFVGTNGYVIRKSTALGAGPLTVTMFPNLAAGAGAGPFSPRGVDNFDPAATEGYFVGVDNATFSTMMFRRVTNPGSATPTISANISVVLPTTTSPNPVTHLGNTGGNNGRLDSLDDRIYAAMVRNGRLWTAHNFRVSSAGVANTAAASRNATRWYEFQNLTTTPTIVQSGTVFDNAATLAAARQYFIPSVVVTGQGHAVLGFTMAGTPVGATPAYVGRLSNDTLGTMVGPPGTAAVAYGTTTANYNPPSDPGGAAGRRWGDYSFTSLDPRDDMTVWTVQEYNQALNSYAVRIGRLAAPPPATPTCSGSPIAFPGPTGNVVIAATSTGGSGFYDPGADLPLPALAFFHLNATVTNAIVNSVTFNNPTQVTLNITALTTGLHDVTLTNPDGQAVTALNCINAATAAPAASVDLTMSKSDGGASVAPGGTVSYTLTYGNAGTASATGVVLTETVPANTTFNAGASTAGWVCVPNNNAGSTCTLAIGGVTAGASGLTATFAVTVVNPVAAGVAQISNTASIADDGANGADTTPGNNNSTDTTPVTAAPDFSITKSDAGASVAPGGTVSYTLTYANAGNQGATGVVLTETVPANTTFNSGASTAGWVCAPNNNAGSTCTLAIGGLAAGGGSQNATFAVTVVNPVPAGTTQISNTASIADDGANGADPTPGNNSGSDTTPVTAAPDFSITKSDSGASVSPGGTVSYTLTYANSGNIGAAGVVLTDIVPANTTFNAGASTAGWVCVPNNNAGSTCTLTIGSLVGASGNQTATFAVNVNASVPGGTTQISNTASIADNGANGADPTPGNNSGSDTTPLTAAPDFSITKSDSGASVAPGGTVSYTLTYANSGNVGATGVVLTETVPANTTFNSGASTAGWVCVPNNNAGSTCTLAIGALGAASGNQTATFAVTVVNPVPAGTTQISNTASIADDGTNGVDPTPGNNSGSDTTPVTAAPDFSITKSDSGASVAPGGTVSYTLSYANSGNIGASGVVLTETVPANTTFNSGASTAGWVCLPNNNAGSTCTLAVGSLVGGSGPQNATFAVTVVNPVPAGTTQISNTASIADNGANGADPTPGNNSGSDTTPVTAAPDFSITKSDSGASVSTGGTVSYTLTYANSGNIGASGVVLTDTVPANTTFNSGASTAGWVCLPNNNAGSTCTLAIGSLAGGSGPQNATFAVTVAASVPGGTTQISNTASIADNGANGADPTPGNNSSTDTTPLAASVDLSIAKSDSGASVAPGGTVTYTLTYGNGGSINSTGVTLTDTVPANTTFNSGASTAGWVCLPNNNAGSTCTLAIGGVTAGASGLTATFAVTVVNPVAAGVVQIANTATIADDGSNGADANAANNTASDTTPLTGAPDLSITKSDGGASATTGGGIAYTLTYANNGNRGASAVAITETVPANTTFNPGGSTAGWLCSPDNNAGSTCTFPAGTMPAGGGNQTVTFAVTVAASVPGGTTQISNTASIADNGANGTDPTPANNSGGDTTPLVTGAFVTGTKTLAGNFVVGGTITYTVILTNSGSGAQADNPGNEFTDILPIQLALVSASASSGTAVATIPTRTVTWNGSLASGASVTITITATIQSVPVGTVVTNQGNISYDGNGDGTNESSGQTDDPATVGGANPTTFTVGAAPAGLADIPTITWVGITMLTTLLAALGIALARRS
jgi:uncharacterized repeat protein (TIGR01451 family)